MRPTPAAAMNGDLSQYPVSEAVQPTLEAGVYGAWARARALGVKLPPLLVLWRYAPAAGTLAETHVDANSPRVKIYVRDDLDPAQGYEAMLHELQHAADHDLIRAGRTSVAKLEYRAEAFTAWAQLDHRRWPSTFDEYLLRFLPGRCA